MATNTLSSTNIQSGSAIAAGHVLQYYTALNGDYVPRIAGTATSSGGTIGTSTYPFSWGWFTGKVISGGSGSPTSTGAFGVGHFHAETDVFTVYNNIVHNDSAGNYPVWAAIKSRGTKASPTIISSGDTIGMNAFMAYDGANYLTSASFEAVISGTPGTTDLPTDFVWKLAPDGSSTRAEVMRLTSAGYLGLGSSAPTSKIHVLSSRIAAVDNDSENADHTVGWSEATHILSRGGFNAYRGSDTNNNGLPGLTILNTNNATSGAAVDGRVVAAISGLVITTDSNAGDDSGGTLEFWAKAESGTLTSHFQLLGSSGALVPTTTNTKDLGTALLAMRDIFTQNAVTVTSDARHKEDIEPTEIGLNLLEVLEPVTYKMKGKEAVYKTETRQKTETKEVEHSIPEIVEIDGKFVRKTRVETRKETIPVFEEYPVYDEEGGLVFDDVETTVVDENGDIVFGDDEKPLFEIKKEQVFHKKPVMEEIEVLVSSEETYRRRHFGYSAQQLKECLDMLEIEQVNFAPLVYDTESDRYSIRYEELIPILHRGILDTVDENKALEKRVDSLESELKDIREMMGE